MTTLSRKDAEKLGFASVGRNTQISPRASFYGTDRIVVGDNVRIDDYCVLSAGHDGITIGDHVHIAVYSSLIGRGQIYVSDFCNLSSRVSLYSSSDDYSGAYMTNPTIPAKFTNINHADVFLGKHVIVGSGNVILLGVIMDDGVAIGALSLVNNNCSAFGIYAGAPARRIGDRNRNPLEVEKRFRQFKQ